MLANLRSRYLIFATISILFLASVAYYLRSSALATSIVQHLSSLHEDRPEVKLADIPEDKPEDKPEEKPENNSEDVQPTQSYPKYKPEPAIIAPLIIDNFPLASTAHSLADLPPIPSWNRPPVKHVDEATPLFIGFTRNWRLLQQAVVSYITAGWPPEDIYVIENTGVMDSNEKGKLSLQNPFFLNYTRLRMFGVNIVSTPTLLSFAQLQNFYLHTSMKEGWNSYFWSHMDIIALSYESHFKKAHPDLLSASADHSDFQSLYFNAVKELRATKLLTLPDSRWAIRFFAYDHLSLVNAAAFIEVGGWDTLIPYYMTDCDMHARLTMAGFKIRTAEAGNVSDVASSLDDLLVLYRKKNTGVKASFIDPNILQDKVIAAEEKAEADRKKLEGRAEPELNATVEWEEDDIYSKDWQHLNRVINNMEESKGKSRKGRNTWQTRQLGGQGDPFYRDPVGFDKAIDMTIQHGRNVFSEKWGHRDCDIVEKGLITTDAWRVEHDW